MVSTVVRAPRDDCKTDGLQPFAILMAELGWAAVRVRDLTRGGYKENVRGYVRRH